MKKFLALALAGWLAFPISSHAQSSGTSVFDYLFIDADARAAGLGGAYTAQANDANALHYNPAGLGALKANSVSFMHNTYFETAQQNYLGLVFKRGFGLQINIFDFGDATESTLSNPLGTGTAPGMSDVAVTLGYGHKLNQSLSLGGAVKFLREKIFSESAQGVAADLGIFYEAPWLAGLALGASLQNMGPAVTFQQAEESLPFSARAGAAYKFSAGKNFDQNTVSLDLQQQRREDLFVGIGAETILGEHVPLRVGYKSRQDAGSGISVGAGWIQNRMRFDYAYAPFGDLDNTHRFSVTFEWGGGEPAPTTAPVPVALPPADADQDGVIDALDMCPNTPAGEVVDSKGCPLDTDQDKVPDYRDSCPGTPAGLNVDEKGCPIAPSKENASLTLHMAFDFGSSAVRSIDLPEVARAADFLLAFPNALAEIEGHSDNVGDPVRNKRLSQKRAESVRKILIDVHHIAPERLTAVGYGSTRPVVDNSTAANRQINRRVVVTLREK